MGAVYRALDQTTNQLVAIKVLRGHGPETAARFQREAQLLASISAPGIVGYLGFGTSSEGDTYTVLEWIEGETLRDRMTRAPLTLRESLIVVAAIAEALAVAHDRGVIHRDLKPANVHLVERPAGAKVGVKILDFGIARVRGENRGLTITGAVLGTPGYMAPEQARSEPDLDVRCDVYAMGCILFRCLSGRPPFQAADMVALLMQTANEEAPSLRSIRPEIPLQLSDYVASMLRRERSSRPANARIVAADLTRLAAQLGDLGPPTLHAEPQRPSHPPASVAREADRGSAPEALAAVPRRKPSWRIRWLALGGLLVLAVFSIGLAIPFITAPKRDRAPKRAASANLSSAPAPSAPIVSPAFQYLVEDPADAGLARYVSLWQSGRLNSIVRNMEKNFALANTVSVVGKQCGKSGAYYQKQAHRIEVCFELARELHEKLRALGGMSDEAMSEATLDILTFVTLHQMGHALLVEADLAVPGDEEVAADEFATLTLIDMGQQAWLTRAARTILALDQSGKMLFAIEHAIQPERVHDIMCLVYGSRWAQRAELVGAPLPVERVNGCEAEYQQKDKAWTFLLHGVIRTKP